MKKEKMKKGKKETLLEKAQKLPRQSKYAVSNISDEEIELCLAWLKGQITITQVAKVLGLYNNRKYTGNIVGRINGVLKVAYSRGKINL
jgi:hypothetical protein